MNRAEAGAEHDGVRFDKVLAEVAGVSRSAARALIDSGEAFLNETIPAPKAKVRAGDVIDYPPAEAITALRPDATVPFDIVASRDHYLVVDKPAGVVVHPGTGVASGTLVHGLLAHHPEIEGVGQPGRWGIVHRLDRDTSGLLLVARTADGYRHLTGMLAARQIHRTYAALARGRFDVATGTIDAPIRRHPERPMQMTVHRDGKPARTHYRRIEQFAGATLLSVELETGRTHQIRVHLASIGHPVVGDPVYGGRDPIAVPRIFLHAQGLEFEDPFTASEVSYVSEIPPDLAAVLTNLRRS